MQLLPSRLLDGLDASYRIQFVHQARNIDTLDTVPDPTDVYKAFTTVDLSMTVSHGSKWDVTAYYNNILDEKYWLSNTTVTYFPLHGGIAYFQPRMFGLRVNFQVVGGSADH